MPLDAPTNCWSAALASFVDALAASAQFQTLVGAADAAAAATAIFGKRLTHTQDGHAWTREELENLRHYGQVFAPAAGGYGKHLAASSNYRPHGAVVVAVGRLVPEAELVAASETQTGLTVAHWRAWHQIVGVIADQVAAWLHDHALLWLAQTVEAASDVATPVDEAPTRGVWQGTELMFTYREE